MSPLRQALVHMRAGRRGETHHLAQEDHSRLGARLHSILHIQEGDLENARYWQGKGGRNFRQRGSLEQEMARFEAALPNKPHPAAETRYHPPVPKRG